MAKTTRRKSSAAKASAPTTPRPSEPAATPAASPARLHPQFAHAIGAGALGDLVGRRPVLHSVASRLHDGRRDAIVLVLARTPHGDPAPGVLVRLVDGSGLRDAQRTDAHGMTILRIPSGHVQSATAAANGRALPPRPPYEGFVEVGAPHPTRIPVSIPPTGPAHRLVEVAVPPREIPAEAAVSPFASGAIRLDDAARFARPGRAALALLPSEFEPALLADLVKLRPAAAPDDALLGGLAASLLAGARPPQVRRLVVARLAAAEGDTKGAPPRRYLVRLRQEWTFLGHAFGGIRSLDGVAPEIRAEGARFRAGAPEPAPGMLPEPGGSIDAVLRLATLADARALAAGALAVEEDSGTLAAPPPSRLPWEAAERGPSARPALDPVASLGADLFAALATRTDVSVEANAQVRAAAAAHNARLSREARPPGAREHGAAPLVSRATNIARIALHETYAVATHVEDVLELKRFPFARLDETPLLTDEEIVEHERLLAPHLLDRALAPQFAELRRAIAARRSADLPVGLLRVAVEFDSPALPGSASLVLAIDGREVPVTMALPRGARVAEGYVRLEEPVPADRIASVRFSVDLREDLAPSDLPGSVRDRQRLTATTLAVRFEAGPGLVLGEHRIALGPRFEGIGVNGSPAATFPLRAPPVAAATEGNPLVVHVHRNRAHYFARLVEAAMREPALRADVPALRALDERVWRLPVVAVEGEDLLVVAEASGPEAQHFLADPGAATLLSIAVPGALVEAVPGASRLDLAEGTHPILREPPAAGLAPEEALRLLDRALEARRADDRGLTPEGAIALVEKIASALRGGAGRSPEDVVVNVLSDLNGAGAAGTAERTAPDGTRLLPDGTRVEPDGTWILPDGTRILSNGTRVPVEAARPA